MPHLTPLGSVPRSRPFEDELLQAVSEGRVVEQAVDAPTSLEAREILCDARRQRDDGAARSLRKQNKAEQFVNLQGTIERLEITSVWLRGCSSSQPVTCHRELRIP